MAKTPAQRGEFGRWLKRVREERYRTQELAREDMRRLAGLTIGESEYAQWESGSRVPRADNPKVERLYEFFGSRPQTEPEAPSGIDQTALLAAMAKQTAAISALVDLLRPLVEQGEEDREARLRAVEAELRSLRTQRVGGGSPGRSSPLGSAG